MPPADSTAAPARPDRNPVGLRNSFIDILGWIITIAWAASLIADAVLKDYDPPISIHAVMMLVAGAAFGGQFIKKGE